MEIAQALQQEKNIPVIFISFNNTTGYEENETDLPINSLLSRIAYAIAKPSSTKGLDLHNQGRKKTTIFNFRG
jgi:hypothetical protein